MSSLVIGLIGLFLLFALLILRVPVGISMMAVGVAGITALNGFKPAIATLASETFSIASSYSLSVIPLFILMGNLAAVSGLSRNLYDAAFAWIGSFRGGLASATIVGCGGFAAVSGSSLASAVTMGRVALPEMQRLGYDTRLATGTVTAGGTLGILIPPSTGFIIYAVLAEQSIGRLFIAGILPGLLLAGLFIITVAVLTTIQPAYGPRGPQVPLRDKLAALWEAGPFLGVIIMTIGGIYAGIFTPVEAAGVGALLVFIVTLLRRKLTWHGFQQVLLQTVRTTAMFYIILIGAHVFGPFMALSHTPDFLGEQLLGLSLGVYGTLAVILMGYIVLGTFMEGFAMLVLTLPMVMPIVASLGIDPIWFGVLVVVVLEMGLITPPVGMNVFAVRSIVEDVPMSRIFIGVAPFWVAMAVCLVLLVMFPQISLFLPNSMFGS